MNHARSFRELREQTGLTLTRLAQETSVPVNILSDLERGKGRPSSAALTSLAQVYRMPVEDLYDLCPVPKGLQELLLRPGVRISEALTVRLCRLEVRGGQTLSADDWASLSEQLTSTD